MQESMKQFVQEGFKRFPEAMEAVVMFSNSVKSQLAARLEERSDWASFTPSKPEKITSGGPPVSGECWLYAAISGQLGKSNVYIDVGYWWNPPGIDLPVIAYACFSDAPATLKRYSYKPKNNRVKVRVISGETRLLLEPAGVSDLTDDINVLLDELIGAATMLVNHDLKQD